MPWTCLLETGPKHSPCVMRDSSNGLSMNPLSEPSGMSSSKGRLPVICPGWLPPGVRCFSLCLVSGLEDRSSRINWAVMYMDSMFLESFEKSCVLLLPLSLYSSTLTLANSSEVLELNCLKSLLCICSCFWQTCLATRGPLSYYFTYWIEEREKLYSLTILLSMSFLKSSFWRSRSELLRLFIFSRAFSRGVASALAPPATWTPYSFSTVWPPEFYFYSVCALSSSFFIYELFVCSV